MTRPAELLLVVAVLLSFLAMVVDWWWPAAAVAVVLAAAAVLHAWALPRLPDDDWDTCPCRDCQGDVWEPMR